MMKILLTRNTDDATETLGSANLLTDLGNTVMYFKTLERPDKNNANGISCIPKGTYLCSKVPPSHIPYEHIAVQNVSGRSGICIHKANEVTQLEGCIAVGDSYGDINKDGEPDVLNSGATFDKLMALLPNEFQLIIN